MKTAVQYLIEKLETSKWQDSLGKELTMAIHEDVKTFVLEMEKRQMADAFYAPANEAEPKNFDEYYKQKYEDENTY
jgi:hypothetical protein